MWKAVFQILGGVALIVLALAFAGSIFLPDFVESYPVELIMEGVGWVLRIVMVVVFACFVFLGGYHIVSGIYSFGSESIVVCKKIIKKD